jgi:hypothetical protein
MSSIYNDIKNGIGDAWEAIEPYFPFSSGVTKINDLNKEAAKNTLTLYTVVSSNAPDSIRAVIAENIEIKFAAILTTIIENTFLNDPKKIGKFFEKRLSNNDSNNQIGDYVDDVASMVIRESAKDGYDVKIKDLSITSLTEGKGNKHREEARRSYPKGIKIVGSDLSQFHQEQEEIRQRRAKGGKGEWRDSEGKAADPSPKIQKVTDDIKELNRLRDKAREEANKATAKRNDEQAKLDDAITSNKDLTKTFDNNNKQIGKQVDAMGKLGKQITKLQSTKTAFQAIKFSSNQVGNTKNGENQSLNFGRNFVAKFNLATADGKTAQITISFNFIVNMMDVESEKLVDTIASAKSRDNFFNYLGFRAGTNSFWKDFVFNLKEIDKEVARDTSQDLRDRILADMVKSSGLTTPKIWGDLAETRHYILVLDKSDVELLKKEHKFNIENPANLKRVFELMRILTLIIVNPDRTELTFYDSSNPMKFHIMNYKKVSNEDDAFKRFIMSMKN